MTTGKIAFVAAISILLAGCGGSSGIGDDRSLARPVPETVSGTVPAMPPEGETRPGRSYRIAIVGAHGESQVFQVIEPRRVTAGETYPLVLHSHGFSGSRETEASRSSNPIPLLSAATVPALVDHGYGVISIDQRGHGESGGTIRVMDPDYAGRNLIRILDWAEAHIPWLAYGPDADAQETNLVLGAIGRSYGGGFQLILNAIDPEKRMDAMVPQITWNDLTFSLNPGGVIKSGWALFLYAAGNRAGDGFNFDPFVTDVLLNGLLANQFSQAGLDFFRYHGQGYFCDGVPVATNGGPGTKPDFAPVPPGKVAAMFWQGFRDTLFNFNEAYANYQCLKRAGGDVRLLTYQSGHNSIPIIPDLGATLSPDYFTTITDTNCGGVNLVDATLKFFNQHLKGQEGAADPIPELCLSLSAEDDVLPDSVTVGGRQFDLPTVNLIAGASPPMAIPQPAALDFIAEAGQVLAGIPTATLTIEHQAGTDPMTGEPVIFVGVGTKPANGIKWELVDNQILPLRGTGTHSVHLIGVAERLQPGDQIALLLYAAHPQYAGTGSLRGSGIVESIANSQLAVALENGSLLKLPLVPVTVSGTVSMPIISDPANANP